MSQPGEVLQRRVERGRAERTMLEFLGDRMDDLDRVERRQTLKERLGFLKGMSCCGVTSAFRPAALSILDEDDDEDSPPQQVEAVGVSQIPTENAFDQACVSQIPAASGMNLATALAAERHYRSPQDSDGSGGGSPERNGGNRSSARVPGTVPGTPARVSLMRLLVETAGGDGERRTTVKEESGGGVGCDSMCCVCMERKKGAALIPCGHTFCRVCSREVWLTRASCPLCNRSIVEILDIF
ncbi:hypothetical protein U1Q18_010979 [Sarracenia purpurea var. burkii]